MCVFYSVHSNIEYDDEVEDGSDSEQAIYSSGGFTTSSEQTPKRRKKTENPDLMERYLAAKELRDREREEGRELRRDDDISLFLQSLAPVMRRLPPSKQSSVKMCFHQVLHEAEYGHTDIPPSS